MTLDPSAPLYSLRDPSETIAWFVEAVGADRLRRRVEPILEAVRSGEMFPRSALEQHHLELMIADLFGICRLDLPEAVQAPLVGDAIAFLSVARNFHEALTTSGRGRHIGMIKNALNSSYGFAAVRTEYTAAQLGIQMGCSVTAIDIEGLGTFDFLLDKDGEEVEIECKLMSNDFAAVGTKSRFDRLLGVLNSRHRDELLRPGASTILRVSMSGDFPKSNEDVRLMGRLLADAVSGAEVAPNPFFTGFARQRWAPGEMDPSRSYAEASFITTVQGHPTIELHDERAAVIVVFELPVGTASGFRRRVETRFKEAASQCSGTRPAVLFAEAQGPWPAGPMVEIARKAFEEILPEVFRARPHLELVILAFAGPPFSSGVTFPVRNKRRKRRNQSYLMRALERAAVCPPLPLGSLPNHGFRSNWWREKFNWGHKSPQEMRDAIRSAWGAGPEKRR